jgi:hypothetical protein
MDETREIWKLPQPSSGGINSSIEALPGRNCVLVLKNIGDGNDIYALKFIDVSSYRVYYLPDLTDEMVEMSYDRLIADNLVVQNRRLYMITLDDGPCYCVRASDCIVEKL